jgi:hypothetical protein
VSSPEYACPRETGQRAGDPYRPCDNESIELAHEIFNPVFRKVPEKMNGKMR